MNLRNHHGQMSESLLTASFIILSGGLQDAYTYLCRGKVFANAQTGNMVLLAVRLAEGSWAQAFHYLMPILAFALGILVAEVVRRNSRHAGRFHWRHTVLLVEMAVLVAVALAPVGEWDSLVNVAVSFVCALQVETFRKVRGYPFASTMCTGNLRSGTDALFHGLADHDPALTARSGCYFAIIACFLVGAALGGVISPWFPQGAVLTAAVFQGVAFLWMFGVRPQE